VILHRLAPNRPDARPVVPVGVTIEPSAQLHKGDVVRRNGKLPASGNVLGNEDAIRSLALRGAVSAQVMALPANLNEGAIRSAGNLLTAVGRDSDYGRFRHDGQRFRCGPYQLIRSGVRFSAAPSR
jgi:hypothetical protein